MSRCSTVLCTPGLSCAYQIRGLFALLLAITLQASVSSLGDPRRESPETPTTEPAPPPAASLFAEGLYADETLRDPERAAEYYRRVLAHPDVGPEQPYEATWRLARALRRLNRPDAARQLLTELLRDPALPTETREIAEAELGAMPLVEPSRLMPADTLVYVEVPNPGQAIEQAVGLLKRAGLDEAVRRELVLGLRRRGAIEVSGFLNESMQAELRKIEGLGLGWHNFRFEEVDGQRVLTSDVLIVLYTGQSVATAGILQGLLLGLMVPESTIEGVGFFAAAAPRPELRCAITDGLFVACSDARAGADAVLRHAGKPRGPSLFGLSSFKRRPASARRADSPSLYVDWPKLVELMIQSTPEPRRDQARLISELLSLRQIGPLFGALRMDADRIEVELTAFMSTTDTLMYRLFRTPPLEEPWLDWLPVDAGLGVVTSLAPGERRWRDLERFLFEEARVRFAREAVTRPADAGESDVLAGIRAFERSAQLNIGDDICRGLRGGALVWLGPAPNTQQIDPATRWVLALDVAQADAWMRRIEQGLRQLLFGALSDSPLPKTTLLTPVGEVEMLSIPRTRIGITWQVSGRRVVFALGADALVEYLSSLPEARSPAARREGPSENKRMTMRLDYVAQAVLGGIVRPGTKLRPLVLRTYEQEDRVRVMIEQEDASEMLRAVAELLRDAPAGGGLPPLLDLIPAASPGR